MQQRLVSPVIQRGGRFVEGRAWSQEAVKTAKPLDSAHSLPTGWQRKTPEKAGGTDGLLLPGVGVGAGL